MELDGFQYRQVVLTLFINNYLWRAEVIFYNEKGKVGIYKRLFGSNPIIRMALQSYSVRNLIVNVEFSGPIPGRKLADAAG